MVKRALLTIFLVQSVYALTLNEAVTEVINTHPSVQERLKNYRATEQDLSIADSGYLPTIDLVSSVGHKEVGHLSDDVDRDNFDMYRNSIILRQNLFSGFDTLYRVNYEKARVVAAAYKYVEKADDVALQMVGAYINLLRANKLYKATKEHVANNELIYSKVYELYTHGAASRSEIDKIQSSLSLSRSNLTVRRNNLVDARYKFHRILGRNVSIDSLEMPNFDIQLPVSKIRALQFAVANNPSMQISKFNIKGAQELYKQAKSNYYPTLDFEASQNYGSGYNDNNPDDDDFEVLLKLKYNLYNGGADSAKKQKSISKIHQETDTQRALKRELIESLGISWSAYELLGVQLDDLQKFQSYSLSTLKLYNEEYGLGQRSLLDLLAAQNDYFNAQTQIINARSDRLLAQYRVLDGMGVLVMSVLGNKVDYYKNVGLSGADNYKSVKDELPVKQDMDNDKITDNQDMCTNSEANSSVMAYGCEQYIEDRDDDGVMDNEDMCPNTPLGLEIDKQGCPISKKLKINFKPLSDELEDNSILKIEQFARFLKENPLYNIIIVGHTDSVGTEQENLLLSQKRADAVKDKIVSYGIDEVRVKAVGVGASQPIADNATQEGKDMNRRIEIQLNYIKDSAGGES